MSALDPLVKRLRALEPERLLNLRPTWPPVAIEVDRGQMALARVRRVRGGKPSLEGYRVHASADTGGPALRLGAGSFAETAGHIKELFEKSGTKPGRVSLVLPDNLAKISIVSLAERPAGSRELQDVLRFKLRKSVPFKLEDAVLSSWPLPSDGTSHDFLVAVMLRSVVEPYEAALEAAGARPGLVDLATPSIFNLVRGDLAQASKPGRDAALLNCAHGYFTLVIVKGDRMIFFRCKSHANGDAGADAGAPALARELASSLSYYQEKLAGSGIGTVLVRTVSQPIEAIASVFARLGIDDVRAVDPAAHVDAVTARPDAADAARLLPALGAAAGRAVA